MKSHAMDKFNKQDSLINLKLFKQLQFYQIFDSSDGIKIFRWNIRQLFYIVYAVIGICIQSYGISTSFTTNCNRISNIDYFLLFFTSAQVYISCWKLIKFLNDRDGFLDLFKITQFNFLTTKECSKYSKVLYKHRDKTIKFTNYYLIFTFVVGMQWLIFPLMVNVITNLENSNIRAKNVMNLCFDVTTQTYNQYIVIFYLIETATGSLTIYILVMFDCLLISLCLAIISQQDVLINTFKNIGHDIEPQINYYKELKSILHDQLQLNLKIKLFYSIMKPTILFTVAVDSFYFIILTYLFILVCLTPGSETVLTLIKIGSTIVYITARLFIYCNLFENINIQRELVNFNIYSCNWTVMDLKFKNLLLFTLRMNNANQMVLKASPKKIINLQLFANIISTSFNMVPVLLKITNSGNHKSQ